MSGISDTVFRQLIREMGAEVVVSELISSEGLVRGGQRTHDMAQYCEQERPVGIQVFGGEVPTLVKACKIVEDLGADFVDFNLGCPVKKVVKTGAGSAWLKDPPALGRALEKMKNSVSIPFTIKIRTGWDRINVNEVVRVAYESGVEWVAIHGRTRTQGYSGQADWDLIRSVAQQSPIPIIGNGDILTAETARSRIQQGDAHAVMIGRGALKNPWIFKELTGAHVERTHILDLVGRHFELALDKKEPKRAFLSLKKFVGWYAAGLPGASQFRRSIFSTHSVDELRAITFNFFEDVNFRQKLDDGQPFLMGGHG